MDRAQAIDWLRSVGRNASARDWALGETIYITIGEPQLHQGVKAFPGAVYLRPAQSGGWDLIDFAHGRAESVEWHGDLASAARAAHDYIARQELTSRPL